MQIVADENIPLLNEFFADFGTITTVDGRAMTSEQVRNADILLVRSVTQVNEALLSGSAVKFVGTATIGTDHIDLSYLEQAGIGFKSAPGCNAQAVVDYVISALITWMDARAKTFQELTVAIVGVGNVGGLLRQRLQALGVSVLAVDPLKAQQSDGDWAELEPALRQADVVTLHTPLTKTGEHATYHLLNGERLALMKPDACLINSSRGAVVDNAALLAHLQHHADFEAVLDVWENEPELDLALMDCCLLATPHIAGYSLDGKMRGTEFVYQGLCEHLGVQADRKLGQFLPEPAVKGIKFSDQASVYAALRTAVRAAYEVRVDDGVMRNAMHRSNNLKTTFDALRKHYPLRRDIPTLRTSIPARCHDLRKALEAVGFDVRVK